MKPFLAACVPLAFVLAGPAFGQSAPIAPQVAPSPVIAFPPTSIPAIAAAVLRAGTPVSLKLLEEVTTKEKAARVGQRLNLEVAAPVEINGVIVIPAGTPAWGERDQDRYGRDLRVVVCNGRSLGDQLVSEGLARTWTGRREPWC